MINTTLKTKSKNNYLTILLLILSFVWINIYPSVSTMVFDFSYNYGNLFDSSSIIFSSALINILINAIISWVWIELIFIFYRFILNFKIYSFVVPVDRLKNELRTFFIYRNLILGLFFNICFIFPFIHTLSPILDLIITFTTFICFAFHIKKYYSESIIGHFVFKCFISPIIIYEFLVVIINFVEVIL